MEEQDNKKQIPTTVLTGFLGSGKVMKAWKRAGKEG